MRRRGAFGYPPDEAAPIALRAIHDFLDRDAQRDPLRVSIVLASADHERLYRALLQDTATRSDTAL